MKYKFRFLSGYWKPNKLISKITELQLPAPIDLANLFSNKFVETSLTTRNFPALTIYKVSPKVFFDKNKQTNKQTNKLIKTIQNKYIYICCLFVFFVF